MHKQVRFHYYVKYCNYSIKWQYEEIFINTRMHSSRMRTARSSSHRGGGLHQAPSWDQAPPQDQAPFQDQAPPWTRHPPRSRPPSPGTGTPPTRHPPEQEPPKPGTPRGQTHACKHITLPQTSFASGKYVAISFVRVGSVDELVRSGKFPYY